MRLDPPKTVTSKRPAAKPAAKKPASPMGPFLSETKGRPRPKPTNPFVASRQQTKQNLRGQQKPSKPNGRLLLEPDAATKRLLELTIDPATGQMKAGAGGGKVLGTMAQNLASRKGKEGAGSYLALASVGIPATILGANARKNVADYLKKLAADGVDLEGVPPVNVLDQGERDQIRAILKKRGTDPGDDATDAQLLTATKKKKLSNIDIVKNIPSSAGNALIGLPVGAWGAGQATGALVFDQDAEPLKTMGSGLVDYYGAIKRHPLGALQRDPVGTVSALMPAKTIIGGGGAKVVAAGALGKGAKAAASAARKDLPIAAIKTVEGAAPQTIKAAGLPILRSNLIDRAVQRGLEGATTKSGSVQRYRLKKQAIRENAMAKADTYQIRDQMLRGLQEARRGTSVEERRSIVAYAQGETPSRLADYYEQLIRDEPHSTHNKTRKAQVKIWRRVAEKTGDSPTPKVAAYLEALRIPLAKREEIMTNIGKVPEEQIAARRGLVSAETERVLGSRSPLADEAQYVPHIDTTPQYGNFLVKRGLNPEKRLAKSAKKNELVLFKRGSWQPDSRIVESSLAHASNVEQMRNTLVRNIDEYGRVGKPGEPYEGTLFRIGGNGQRRVMQPGEAGPALSQMLKEMHIKNEGASEADLIAQLEQKIIAKPRSNRIPEDGATYIVLPKQVGDQLVGEFGAHRRGAALRAASTATDTWRKYTLFARPAWLAANMVSNPIQAGIGMADSPGGLARIPVSYARTMSGHRIPLTNKHLPGRDYSSAVPDTVRDAGWFNDLTKIQHAGANADTPIGRTLIGIANSAEGRMLRKILNAAPNAIVNVNQWFENVNRSAVYLHQAVPAAKKAANGTKYSKVTDDVMKHLEAGEVSKATELVRDTLGDMRQKNRPNWRLVAPFYKWLMFASKLALVTLPLKMPIRNELLQALGRDGMKDINALGGPALGFQQGAIPFDAETRTADDGSPHQFAKMLATRNINTLATPAEFLKTDENGMPTIAGALSYGNPLASAALSTVFGKDLESGYAFKDADGNDLHPLEGGFDQFFKTLINQEARTLPFVNLLDDPSGKPADALPFTADAQEFQGMRQPKRSKAAKIAQYLTGVNVREADLTLYNVQWMYHFLDPRFNKDLPPELEKEIRKKLNRMRGKSGPYAKQQRDAKKAKEAAPVSVTVPIGGGYSVPEYSVPEYSVPEYTTP
jgi:hypothetical protein